MLTLDNQLTWKYGVNKQLSYLLDFYGKMSECVANKATCNGRTMSDVHPLRVNTLQPTPHTCPQGGGLPFFHLKLD